MAVGIQEMTAHARERVAMKRLSMSVLVEGEATHRERGSRANMGMWSIGRAGYAWRLMPSLREKPPQESPTRPRAQRWVKTLAMLTGDSGGC